MRCRALAGEWRQHGGAVTFLTTSTSQEFLDRLRQEGCEVLTGQPGRTCLDELDWLVPILQKEQAGLLILDGYDFDEDYQQEVKSWVNCLVCLDDVPKRRFACDVLLNQNLGVSAGDYEPYVLPETTLLLGTRYALLRSEFKHHAGSYRVTAKPRQVLVTLGGADPDDHTARVLKELANDSDLEIDVVLGALYPHPDPVSRTPGLNPNHVRVHRGLNSLLSLAKQTDLAVTGGGSTVWELACLGTPMVVLGTADSQEALLRGLRAEQAALVLGPIDSITSGEIIEAVQSLLAVPSRLQELSQSAARLVDGLGAERVIDGLRGAYARVLDRRGVSTRLGSM